MLGSNHARISHLFFGGFLLLSTACGGPGKPAVASAAIAAIAIEEASNFTAPLYRERADTCYEESTNWSEYDACLAGWNALVRTEMQQQDGRLVPVQVGAIVAAEEAVLALEDSLASWESLSGDEKLVGVLKARDAVVKLLAGLEAVGVDEPFLVSLRRYLTDLDALLEAI